MTEAKKYYWLKLQKDFFKRNDIRIIEAMPNGKDYILFYLKLLCESVDAKGRLRFSEAIPFNEDMLSLVTGVNVDVVRQAVKIFSELKMLEILDDGTYYMNEVEKIVGFETEWAEKKRLYRANRGQNEDNVLQIEDKTRTKKDNVRQEIEKEIEIEKDIKEKFNKKKIERFTPPSLNEVLAYCKERNNNIDAEHFYNYYTANGWMVGKNKMKDWKAAVRTWERNGYSKPKDDLDWLDKIEL